MKIQLIRNESCPNWQKTEELLKEALSEAGLSEDYEVIVVEDDEKAKEYRFFGSPQIIIDGKDIDPLAAKASDFHFQGCRFYLWEGKVLEHPPKKMILQALQAK
jgi:glutaredoxin